MSAEAAADEPPLPVAAVTCNGAWLPAVDVRELPDEYIVLADLPGLKPGDVDVTSDDNILTIAGARRDRLQTGGVAFRLERPTGKLLRSLRLPDGCDAAELEAHIQGRRPRGPHTQSGAHHSQRNLRRTAGGGMRASLRARVPDDRHGRAGTVARRCPR